MSLSNIEEYGVFVCVFLEFVYFFFLSSELLAYEFTGSAGLPEQDVFIIMPGNPLSRI